MGKSGKLMVGRPLPSFSTVPSTCRGAWWNLSLRTIGGPIESSNGSLVVVPTRNMPAEPLTPVAESFRLVNKQIKPLIFGMYKLHGFLLIADH